jgi:tyrosyl-tRNA synthetase
MAETPSTSSPQTAAEKLALIKHNLQEVLNEEIITEILNKNERPLKLYWGTATTGKPHCGYLVPMLKIAEFLAAGCEVTVLLADVHGFLDNLKAPIELIEHRAKYYNYCITETLQAVGVDVSRLKFVLGSSYQTTGSSGAKYFMDLLRLSTAVSGHDATKAGSEVVKQVDSPPLSSQIYPLMQALDEEYLGVDAQFGGVDQRKIFTLAVEALPRVGFAKRAHLMNPLIPGLQEGGKMSSSDPDSKIDLKDPPEIVRKKMKKAFCPPKQVEGNGVLSFVEFVLLPASALRNPTGKPLFKVPRRDAEDLEYTEIASMHKDYLADVLQPQTLKPAATEALLQILEPIQKWKVTELKAYPPPAAPPQKKKKEKKIGTRFPGAVKTEGGAEETEVEAQADGSVTGSGAQEVSVGKSSEEALEKLTLAAEGVNASSS